MECPVCGSQAEDIAPPDCSRHSVRCSKCGDYDISASALLVLAAVDKPGREAALLQARRFAERMPGLGSRPCIATVCFGAQQKT